jgi:hypothetical protein
MVHLFVLTIQPDNAGVGSARSENGDRVRDALNDRSDTTLGQVLRKLARGGISRNDRIKEMAFTDRRYVDAPVTSQA